MKQLFFKNKLLLFVSAFTLLLCFAFALNLSPFLRGPNDPLLESHWPYYFINTFSKLWAPVLIALIYLALFIYIEKRSEKLSLKKEILMLLGLTFLVFLFQISLVYFSRFGITILFRRIADYGINGYFTAAIHITDVHSFLENYPKLLVTSLPQHARGDPPGATLLIYYIVQFFNLFPEVAKNLVGNLHVNISQNIWLSLTNTQRLAALFSGFFLHLLSAITVIPMYYLVKFISDRQTAFRAAFLWGIIPSLTFFSLIFDPFYTVFPMLTFIFIALGVKKKNLVNFFTAGFIFSIGLFFTPSILPLLFFLLLLLMFLKNFSKLKILLSFLFGLLLFPLILLLFGYNTLTSGIVLIDSQAPRDYLSWLIFNPYDVFVYMGIPISILFIYVVYKVHKVCNVYKVFNVSKVFNVKSIDSFKVVVLSFVLTFAALVVSGISRGEVGRIWISLMIVPIGAVAYYFSKIKKNTTFFFIIILILLISQCIVLEEFWVPIW